MYLHRVLFLLILIYTIASAKTEIKFATVAPDGSTWMNVMQEFTAAVEDSTDGRVTFRIYPGGVAGDEFVVLRKIRVGQLHSGGFTGVGLGEILPQVRILDAPYLFQSYAEVDYVTSELFDYFSQKFEDKGFILLGWAEVGFVYIFTNTPVTGLDDMRGVKMWMWEGDPIAEATFKTFDISPIPLSLTDVLTSLQTNLIDGVYVSPLACVALQWYTKVKYMLDLPLANSNGAILLKKSQFMKLSGEDQDILRKLSRKYFNNLTWLSREDNKKSLDLIREEGIEFTKLNDQTKKSDFYETGKKTRRLLIGKLYDEEFLNKVEGKVEEFRIKHDEN
jgi:TRAP-type C4-dicarboxylate transport system substrate-binding protein